MNIDSYLKWPYRMEIEPEGISIVVKNNGSVKGIASEFDTCCTSIDEVEEMVKSVIIDFAEHCFEEKIPFPAAGKIEQDDKVLTLPLHVALKIILHNIMVSERFRAVDIYKNIAGGSSQKFNQDTKLTKVTKFETLARYFNEVGHPLKIEY